MGFRATTKIKWQINGNRFQQGRYFINYVPTGGAAYTAARTGYAVDAHNSTLTSRTQTFHVEMDINCDTEAMMTIPYVSNLNFVPFSALTSGTYWGQLGRLALWPYSPLVSPAGSTNCTYTIWIWFEDVELIGPAAPQSKALKFESAVSRGRNATESEQAQVNGGPISSSLVRISKAANALNFVPMISDYTSKISWFSEKLAGAAASFGWSRPINLQGAQRITREVMPYFSNIDAPDQSIPLSLSYRNQVGAMPGFSGTDVDEMDFSFFKTIPAWDSNVSWTTAMAQGTSLGDEAVSPVLSVNSRVVGATNVYDFKPYEFLGAIFSLWR
uniref:Capsid protein n=1 Tax=Picornavirales sp. TaxID=1955153 RepID=A0A514D189_9VIRU|nr:MAG: hypothetical protein H4Bulk4738_000002 [Picornavirales sp.]